MARVIFEVAPRGISKVVYKSGVNSSHPDVYEACAKTIDAWGAEALDRMQVSKKTDENDIRANADFPHGHLRCHFG